MTLPIGVSTIPSSPNCSTQFVGVSSISGAASARASIADNKLSASSFVNPSVALSTSSVRTGTLPPSCLSSLVLSGIAPSSTVSCTPAGTSPPCSVVWPLPVVVGSTLPVFSVGAIAASGCVEVSSDGFCVGCTFAAAALRLGVSAIFLHCSKRSSAAAIAAFFSFCAAIMESTSPGIAFGCFFFSLSTSASCCFTIASTTFFAISSSPSVFSIISSSPSVFSIMASHAVSGSARSYAGFPFPSFGMRSIAVGCASVCCSSCFVAARVLSKSSTRCAAPRLMLSSSGVSCSPFIILSAICDTASSLTMPVSTNLEYSSSKMLSAPMLPFCAVGSSTTAPAPPIGGCSSFGLFMFRSSSGEILIDDIVPSGVS